MHPSLDFAIGPARYFGDVGIYYMHEFFVLFFMHCAIWRMLSMAYLYHAMKKATSGIIFRQFWHIVVFGIMLYVLIFVLYVLMYLSRVPEGMLKEIYLTQDPKLEVTIQWV